MFGMAVSVSFHPVLSASLSVSEFAAECGEVGLESSLSFSFFFSVPGRDAVRIRIVSRET
jgi:hypothetical protein